MNGLRPEGVNVAATRPNGYAVHLLQVPLEAFLTISIILHKESDPSRHVYYVISETSLIILLLWKSFEGYAFEVTLPTHCEDCFLIWVKSSREGDWPFVLADFLGPELNLEGVGAIGAEGVAGLGQELEVGAAHDIEFDGGGYDSVIFDDDALDVAFSLAEPGKLHERAGALLPVSGLVKFEGG